MLNTVVPYLPGAQRDKDEIEDDKGHGAAILSVKSQVKLIPVELSYSTSTGKLLSKQPINSQNKDMILQ